MNVNKMKRLVRHFKKKNMFMPLPDNIVIKRAVNVDELKEAYSLVHDVFLEKGYMDQISVNGMRIRSWETLEDMATFIAVDKNTGNIVSVHSVVPYTDKYKIPLADVMPREVKYFADTYNSIYEYTNCADHKDYRNLGIFTHMYAICYMHAARFGGEVYIGECNPTHSTVLKLLDFYKFGDGYYNGDPVVGMGLDLSTNVSRWEQIDESLGEDAFICDFFIKNKYAEKIDKWEEEYREAIKSGEVLGFLKREAAINEQLSPVKFIFKKDISEIEEKDLKFIEPYSDYRELTSRNWGYIEPDEQKKIKKTIVGLAGCGLGSVIAELATRTGFEKFVIADGDNVELSNLNRQAFDLTHVGKNKAKCTAEIIHSINSNASVYTYDCYLDETNLEQFVEECDVLINTIDLDTPAFVEFNRIAKSNNKKVIFPCNIGWGGTAIVFDEESESLDDFLMRSVCSNSDDKAMIESIMTVTGMHEYLGELFSKYMQKDAGWACDPQLGVSASMSASLVVSILSRIANGKHVLTAPDVINLDVWQMHEVVEYA